MAVVVKEGFYFLRVFLVLGSLSPVFLILAIRGSSLINQKWLTFTAIIMILSPVLAFLWRYSKVYKAQPGGNLKSMVVRRLTDRREHLLSYLFPLLLSFWAVDFQTYREFLAFAVVLLFTAIAFWHLQLIYVNLWFALLGYRSVQVEPKSAGGQYLRPIILLTRNYRLKEGEEVSAWRLTNNLYLEKPQK